MPKACRIASKEALVLDTNRINRYRGSIAVAVVGLVILAAYAVWQLDPWADQGARVPNSFQLDLDRQFAVDPDLIHYSLASEFALPLKNVRGIDYETQELELIESCDEGEVEFAMDIRGKEGLEVLEWMKTRGA